MEKTYKRHTVRNSFQLEGQGLHSGDPVSVNVQPGRSGIRFSSGSEWIIAKPENVSDTSRCTCLDGISTIEHLMSALAGLGVTDADVEVTGGELPAADGCAKPYVEAILGVGLEECGEMTVDGPFARVFLQELPSKYAVGLGEGWWRSVYVRDGEFIGRQEFEMEFSEERFIHAIAPARTFVLEGEIEFAQKMGLGQGLDKSSCLIVGANEYVNPARYSDEPARHKMLDMIGDLALSGVPAVHLDVVGEFTSHKWNVVVAKKIADSVRITRS